MEKISGCIICGNPDVNTVINRTDAPLLCIASIECQCCGNYSLEYSLSYDNIKTRKPYEITNENRSQFIGYTRELTLLNRTIDIKLNDFKTFITTAIQQAPKTVPDKIDKLLINLSRLANNPSSDIEINPVKDYALGYCVDENEFKYYLKYLDEINFFKQNRGSQGYKITVDGWKKIQDLSIIKNVSEQCFIAMWFTDEMNKVYLDYISKAIERAGYKPMIIPDVKHDNEVTSQILAEIQKSKFMIADFTGQRAGVYFEAGFAKGLGLNVIWTCKKDWFDNKEAENEGEYKINDQWKKGIIKQERHTHFDVNHRQFILWEYDAKEKLNKFEEDIYNSIVEQFGEGPLKSKGNQDSK